MMETIHSAFPKHFTQKFPIGESQYDQVPAFESDNDWSETHAEAWTKMDRMYDEAVAAGKSRLEAYTICGLPGVQGDKTELEAKLAVWGWFWEG